jgi:hypothetical protein
MNRYLTFSLAISMILGTLAELFRPNFCKASTLLNKQGGGV